MMKKRIRSMGVSIIITLSWMFIFLIFTCPGSAHSGDTLDCEADRDPNLNGIISDRERAATKFVQIDLSGDAVATVYYSQNGNNLYVAFDIPTPEHDQDDSGILFDTKNDGGSSPKRDDIVIQQRRDGSEKREARGTGRWWLYIAPSGWMEETSTSNSGWQIEYIINLPKLDITPEEAKTIGIGFHIWDGSIEYDWPVSPCFNRPDSWADMWSSDNWGEVDNLPPVAEIKADKTSGTAPLTVAFTGSGTDPDPDGVIELYHWDFDDGYRSDEQNVTHTYERPGTYNTILTVADNYDAVGNDTITIIVYESSNDGTGPPDTDDGNGGNGGENGNNENETASDDEKEENENESSSGFIPGFELLFLLGGVLGIIAIFKIRRR